MVKSLCCKLLRGLVVALVVILAWMWRGFWWATVKIVEAIAHIIRAVGEQDGTDGGGAGGQGRQATAHEHHAQRAGEELQSDISEEEALIQEMK